MFLNYMLCLWLWYIFELCHLPWITKGYQYCTLFWKVLVSSHTFWGSHFFVRITTLFWTQKIFFLSYYFWAIVFGFITLFWNTVPFRHNPLWITTFLRNHSLLNATIGFFPKGPLCYCDRYQQRVLRRWQTWTDRVSCKPCILGVSEPLLSLSRLQWCSNESSSA